MNFINVEYLAELLYWIKFDFTGVPNKETSKD